MISPKNILPVTNVKKNLMSLLKQVQSDSDPVIITKDGKAAGVLMSADDYESLVETLEILSDKSLMKSLKKGIRELDQGRVVSHAELFK